MNIKKFAFGLLFSVSVVSLFIPAAFAQSLKPYPIGSLFAMTGPHSYYGRIMSRGAITAIDQLNNAGGVSGYKLDLTITDFREASVDLAISGVRKMILIDKTPAVLASFSAVILGVQPICAEKHVVMINGAAGSPKVSNKPYLLSTRMHYGLVLPYGLKYLWDKGYRKLAMVTHNDPSGTDARDQVAIPLWKKWGGQIVASEMNEIGVVDFSSQMARVKAAKPDLILMLQTGDTVAYAIKGARDMGLTQPLLTMEWLAPFPSIIGVERCSNIFTAQDSFDRTSNDPVAQKFIADYEKRFGEQAEVFSANYYDAVYNILAELIRRVTSKGGNPLDGGQLNAAVWEKPEFDTVYGGKMSFRKDGTVRKACCVFEVTKGKLNLLMRVEPSKE